MLNEDFETLCSNGYEDEELRLDDIDTSGFTKTTDSSLRHFLFGALEESEHDFCDNFSFLRLLFGSMGTFDSNLTEVPSTLMNCDLGWVWTSGYKDAELRKQMVEKGIIEEDNYPIILSWLEHIMREVAGTLRPVDRYYKPPTIKDAPCYNSGRDQSDNEGGY
jgi:hypothetical protein